MAAARWWARGGKPAAREAAAGASKVAADLAAFGAPREMVGRWSKAAEAAEEAGGGPPLFQVRPDCWTAVRLFCAMETQWQWVGAGLAGASRTGLRYETLEPTARLSELPLSPALFTDLRLMERAALDEMAVMAREDMRRLERERPTTRKRGGRS